MTKKVTKKEGEKKSPKKVKSFNLDDKIYKNLMELFEASGAQITLSAFVDEFLRKLYIYLIESDGFIRKNQSDFSLSQVIYDCRDIEYFREANKDNNRIKNLIWSYEASRQGLSLIEYLQRNVPLEEWAKVSDE